MTKQPDGIKAGIPIPNDGEMWFMDPETLIPYPNNPRDNKDAIVVVRESIERFGYRTPVEIDADGQIVAGHTRREAAIAEGAQVVTVIKWTKMRGSESRAYRIAHNKTGEAALWDDEKLKAELQALFDAGDPLEGLGFDIDGLNDILHDDPPEPPEEPALPPPPDDPFTKPGQLWALGDHRLLCGDATNASDVVRLLDDNVPAMMVTDPPYGIGYDPEWRAEAAEKGLIAYGASRTGGVSNDSTVDWEKAWSLFPGSDILARKQR